jgi:hypothetical protein
VATASSRGVITGKAAGQVQVRASVSGVTGNANVTVTDSSTGSGAVAAMLGLTTQPPATIVSGAVITPAPVVQLRDASGAAVAKAGVLVTASVPSGGATLSGTLTSSTAATGSATFTGLTLNGSGTTTLQFTATGLTGATSNGVLVSSAAAPPPPPPPPGGSPNILNNASFETGWDGFTDWSGSGTPTGVSRDCSMGSPTAGTCSVRRSWTPSSSDGGSQFIYHAPASDRLWLRFDMKLTTVPTTQMKFMRWYDPRFTTHVGGLYLDQGTLTFGTDEENGNIVTPIGVSGATLTDGKWHQIEMDYWRNGDPSGFPSAAFYVDGKQVSLPDGAKVTYQGAGNSSFWKGGRLYTGVRNSTVQLGYIEMLATLNGGNSTTGSVWIDRVAISSTGRIGP